MRMTRATTLVRFSILLTTPLVAAACGPGRQAAWEKESVEKQKAPVSEEAVAAGQDLVAQAEAAWAERGDRAQLEKAIELWEKILETSPGDGEILTRLSRGYYFLADGYMRGADQVDVKIATFEKGILAGENAMMGVSPQFAQAVKAGAKVEEAVASIPIDGQPAIYWYASNLGKFAVAKGFTTTLFYKDRIFAVMQRVLNLDETFFHGAPHRYFGAFYAKAPGFAGGDMTKSKEHFEKALALDANYLGTKVLYAEYYAAKADERELFTRLLNEVNESDPTTIPELLPEQKIEQDKAKALLAQADDLF